MPRFYLSSEHELTGQDFHHAVNVLRLSVGSEIEVVLGLGLRFRSRITGIDRQSQAASLETIERVSISTEPPARITLIMGIPKPDKIPEIIEYCTQLGASCFVFAVCSRSQGDFDRSVSRKLDHFRKIAKNAAELSGREIIPDVNGPISLAQALVRAKGLKLIPWELESDKTIASAFQRSDEITVCIGPEGGLSHEEIEMAKAQGFTPVTLGKRILRAQLAPVVAISQVLAFLESH